MNKKQNWIIIIIFLIMIFGFTIATLVKPDTDFSEKENRSLAQMPTVTTDSIFDGSFSSDYETYLTDQFVLRNGWIGLKTKVERLALKQEINDVYFAKDGYLIEKHADSFGTDMAKANVKTLGTFMEEMKRKIGVEHAKVMVVPNAVDVLEDKLPAFADGSKEKAYLTLLKESMPEGTYVDVEGVLSTHTNEQLYYRTDHHWKTQAAYYAYEVWASDMGLVPVPMEEFEVKTLTTEFLGTIESKVNTEVEPDSIEAFEPKNPLKYELIFNRNTEEKKDSLYDFSYLDTKDKYSVFYGGNQTLIEGTIENQNKGRLLVIQDSYAHCFVPFTYAHYSEVDMLDLRYFNESLDEFLKTKDYTDVLILYNASGFAEDPSIAKLGS